LPPSDLKFQTSLDAVQTLIRVIRRKLLLGVGRGQIAQMLDDRGLAALQIGDATDQFVELALNPILRVLESLQMFQNQINWSLAHSETLYHVFG
jgi:hypothetical protein